MRPPNSMEADMNETWETSDQYHGELLRDGRYRVIVSKDGIQWILQRDFSAPGRLRGPNWRAIGYCTTRKALTRLWREKTGYDSAELNALLEICEASTEAGRVPSCEVDMQYGPP